MLAARSPGGSRFMCQQNLQIVWSRVRRVIAVSLLIGACGPAFSQHSVARQWTDELLDAIRTDFARPTVHARNLFHVSAAMWDAWAVYDDNAVAWLHQEAVDTDNRELDRREAISYAAYRLLRHRFSKSPGAGTALPAFQDRLESLGYDPDNLETSGDTAAAVGNRIGQAYIDFGLRDGSNEAGDYVNQFYAPFNEPLLPELPGNPELEDPNRWQPLALEFFVDQGGNPIPAGFPEFLSAEWGLVVPFALTANERTVYQRDGHEYWVYHDPGSPPYLGSASDSQYKAGFAQVVEWSGLLDHSDGVMIDISPASRGSTLR